MKLPAITPGPWAVGEDDHNGQAIVRSPHIEIATCWHHCVGSIETEMRSNAKAIAAVPKLLEALLTSARAFRTLEEVAVANLEHEKARNFIELGDKCRAALRLAGASE